MSRTHNTKMTPLVYVIAGKDPSLVNDACAKLLDSLIDPADRPLGLFALDAADIITAADVFDELRTLPFLTKKRVVLIKKADKFVSKNRQLLEKYFDNPSPTGTLIVTVTNWDGRTTLAKKLPSLGKLINVEQPKRNQFPSRLTAYARDAHHKKLDYNAANLLIELAGNNLPQLYSEIDKLALFADEQSLITTSHIESLIGHNRLFNAFAVIDSLIVGDIANAVTRLRTMFAQDRSAEYTFIGAFAYHFRRMFNAKILLQKGSNTGEISKRLQIWTNKESFFKILRLVSFAQLADVLQRLAVMDYQIKTGRTNPRVAAEQFLFQLKTSLNPDRTAKKQNIRT